MSTLRAVIADDEPLALELLESLLAAHDDVEVVARCRDGVEAAEAIRVHRPDVAFLDVSMPGLDGFGAIQSLPPAARPAIVFVTAHERHAVAAFDVDAADYLLKPYDDDRLARALDRVREALARRSGADVVRRVEAALGARPSDRLALRQGERTLLLDPGEIDWIEADGKHVVVHAGGRSLPGRLTLGEVARRLDPRRFLRVSRSAIVAVARIREVQPWFHGDHVVILQDGTQVTSTRAHRDGIERLLKGE